jgi:hypothetical protein
MFVEFLDHVSLQIRGTCCKATINLILYQLTKIYEERADRYHERADRHVLGIGPKVNI